MYSIVYDFADEGLRYPELALPLMLVAVGLALAWTKRRRRTERNACLAFAGLGLLIGALLIPYQLACYRRSRAVYDARSWRVVEGPVEHFDPMPAGGHKLESFVVDGVAFSYSDFDHSYYGFNQTRSHGGPIDAGRVVRLAYYRAGDRNIILRIELRK